MFINIDLLHIVFSNVFNMPSNVKWNVGNCEYCGALWEIIKMQQMCENGAFCEREVKWEILVVSWCFLVFLTMEGTTEKDCSPLWSLYQQIVSDMKVFLYKSYPIFLHYAGTSVHCATLYETAPINRWFWTNYLRYQCMGICFVWYLNYIDYNHFLCAVLRWPNYCSS